MEEPGPDLIGNYISRSLGSSVGSRSVRYTYSEDITADRFGELYLTFRMKLHLSSAQYQTDGGVI
jgi:hypothetical protein